MSQPNSSTTRRSHSWICTSAPTKTSRSTSWGTQGSEPGRPQIFGEGNEELAALFDSAPEAREDVAEIYCILAESNPDQLVESVPELTTALEARPGTQTEANLVTAIATIADSEPVDLRAYRDTFVDLFAEGSLDLSGEVMLVDLLTRIPSTVDIELRPE
ncbi:hypothetical protein [Halolamina pelagica]|uniref:hypothetical protein n=1 Tax=Halolamina pelagica TaxID=699431 RepID=UPI0006CA8936|nr:hypothetical protein [Halolamina pelagica]